MKRFLALAATVCALALLNWALPRAVNPYVQHTIIIAGINIILAVSLNIINGFTGQFSIGHAGFMAVGAYTAGVLTVDLGPRMPLPGVVVFVLALMAGALTAALAGLMVGLPSLRLRGDYLAIATLGFGQIVVVLIYNNFFNLHDIGGAAGFSGLPPHTNFFWAYLFVVLAIWVSRNLVMSVHGRALLTIREDEVAAEAIGVDTTSYKVSAFVIGSAFAGIAGGLEGHLDLTLNPNAFNFMRSITIVVMVVLGGTGSITGSVLAACLLTAMTELLRYAWAVEVLFYGLIILGGVLTCRRYQPKGNRLIALIAIHVVLLGALRFLVVRHGEVFVQQVENMRMVIFSLLLIMLMLTRPGGLFGRYEVGWHTLRSLPGRRWRHAPA